MLSATIKNTVSVRCSSAQRLRLKRSVMAVVRPNCHPERSEGSSDAGARCVIRGRSLAALGMTGILGAGDCDGSAVGGAGGEAGVDRRPRRHALAGIEL